MDYLSLPQPSRLHVVGGEEVPFLPVAYRRVCRVVEVGHVGRPHHPVRELRLVKQWLGCLDPLY